MHSVADTIKPIEPTVAPVPPDERSARVALEPPSVLLLTKDEQVNIEACLRTLAFSDDIVVLDSYSRDKTVELAKKFPNVRVVQRHFDGVHELQGALVAGVEALAQDPPVPDQIRRQRERTGDVRRQGRFGFFQAKTDVRNTERHDTARGGDQKSEIRGQRSEVRGQRSGITLISDL